MLYKVMLIDDEKFILTSLEKRIDWKSKDFEIIGKATSAAVGYEQISLLRPDVVFTDIKMPGMSGIELIQNVSNEFPEIKTVIISGYAEFEYAKSAVEYGAVGYCVKPFEKEEIYGLLDKIKRELDAKRAAADIFQLFGSFAPGDMEHKRTLLKNAGFSRTDSKIIAVLPRHGYRPGPPCLAFRLNGGKDAFVLPAGDLVDLLRMKELTAGISSPFTDEEDLERALEQAREASVQYFVSGKPLGVYREGRQDKRITALLRELQKNYNSDDLEGLTKSFCSLRELFLCEECSVKEAYKVYNTMITFSNMVSLPCDYYESCERLTEGFHSVYEMLEAFERKFAAGLAGSETDDELLGEPMRKILDYVRSHYYVTDLSVQSVSKLFNFNQNYISQLFKKAKNEKFTTYLMNVRMAHAKELLEKSDCSIDTIAEKVGYADYCYFARVFKKFSGMTPGEYRKSMDKKNREKVKYFV